MKLLSAVCESLAARLTELGAEIERVGGSRGDHLRARLSPADVNSVGSLLRRAELLAALLATPLPQRLSG